MWVLQAKKVLPVGKGRNGTAAAVFDFGHATPHSPSLAVDVLQNASDVASSLPHVHASVEKRGP